MPLSGFRVFEDFMKNYKACIFIFSFLVLCSCQAKAQGSSSPDLARVFEDAGLRLLREKVTPRDFSLPTTQGGSGNLASLKGKVVFLNFWATWCGPCRAEMPSMEVLYNRFRDDGLEILAVNCMEKEQEVVEFMREYGLSFPAALDGDGKVSGAYGIQAIPTSYLIDRDGKIIMRLVGSIDWDKQEIHAAFKSLLSL
jgi:thiol-disulfide isomerase/thioredoxin